MEWVVTNDIRAERLAKSANPLALIAAAQPYSDNYYQVPKSQRPSASTRHKGKEIAKPITPQSESVSVSDEDSDPEQAQRDKEMQKNLALLAKYFKKLYKPTNNNLRTSSNSRNKTEDTTPRNRCPKKIKQEEVGEVHGRAYAIKEDEPQGPNVVTSTFLLNNHYAFVLFDSGSDRSFVDTRF
ncbi:hypothetical protein Tco_1147733, partial [Tanacetum coccineum]